MQDEQPSATAANGAATNGHGTAYPTYSGIDPAYANLGADDGEGEGSGAVSIAEFWQALLRGKWIIFIVFIISLIVTLFFVSQLDNVYDAESRVLVKSEASSSPLTILGDYRGATEANLSTQIEIMKTRNFSLQVADQLLKSPIAPGRKDTVRSLMTEDARGRRHMLNRDDLAQLIRNSVTFSPLGSTNILRIVAKGIDPALTAVVANAYAEQYQDYNRAGSAEVSKDNVDFLEQQRDQQRELLTKAENDLEAYLRANNLADVSPGSNPSSAVSSLATFEAQLRDVQITLEGLRASQASYAEKLRAAGKDQPQSQEDDINRRQLTQLAQSRVELEANLTELRNTAQGLEQTGLPKNVEAAKNYRERIATLQAQLNQVNQQIEAKRSDILSTGAPLRDLSGNADLELFADKRRADIAIEEAQAREKALQSAVSKFQVEFDKIPAQTIDLARLQRNQKSAEETFLLLDRKFQEARIARQAAPRNIEIIESAEIPVKPVGPNRVGNTLTGAFIGLALGAGLVLLLMLMDSTLYTPEEIERRGFNLLTTIPVISDSAPTDNGKEKSMPEVEGRNIAAHLVTHFDPKSAVAEAYKTLRTNLIFSAAARNAGSTVMLVTSSAPKEGKSTTASNLAVTLAQGGYRTALIDTDLRRPVVHSVFGLSKDPGVTNYLIGRSALDDIMRPSGIDNLTLITCGTIPPNPAELLGSPAMRRLIEELRGRFDYVLFDSPPVIAVTDAAILSTQVDGVVLVVSSGSTRLDMLTKSRETLRRVNAPLLGTVLNNLDVLNAYGSYYRYYQYYTYYYYGPEGGKPARPKQRFNPFSKRKQNRF